MVRSSQDSSSTRASHNYRFIRRVRNSENRRTPYGTEHLPSPVRRRNHLRGNPSHISFQFTGTTHIQTAIAMMDAESFSLPPANGSFVMPTHEARPQYLRTSVGAGRESSGAGYHQQTQNAGHTYVPGHNIGPAPFLHTDVAGPEYPRDWRYPQPSDGAQMDAVRPGSVTGVQTPAVGLRPAVPGPNIGPAPFLHADVAGPECSRELRYPQPSGGLCNGGFTSGAQMDAVRPGSVTGVQTPAVGLGLAVPGPNIGLAPFLHTNVVGPEYPRDWRYPQPSGGLYNGGFTSGVQMDAVRPGSVTGVQTSAVGLGLAVPGPNIGAAPFLHTDVAGPEYPRDWRYTQPSGGFTSGAQMDTVRPGSVTGLQTPAVGLGPAGSSGVGYN